MEERSGHPFATMLKAARKWHGKVRECDAFSGTSCFLGFQGAAGEPENEDSVSGRLPPLAATFPATLRVPDLIYQQDKANGMGAVERR